jgi:hypothetical protein
LSHLCIKTNILPRQARDKHRGYSKKDHFSSGSHGCATSFRQGKWKIIIGDAGV